jgi:hypothetical protein
VRIEPTNNGFVEAIENGVVEKVVCNYETGTCRVFFYDRPIKELNVGCSSYHFQYGMPVSEDGSKLFVGNWEKESGGLDKGLHAFDITSGVLLWRLTEGKIRNIFVYPKYVIALKALTSVYKLDIDSGKVLGQIRSGTIEQIFYLSFPYVLIDSIKGNLSVLDVESMSIVKNYGSVYRSKKINPSNSLSVVIRDAKLKDGTLTVYGFESDPNKIYTSSPASLQIQNSIIFERLIDTNFDVT